MERLYTKLKEYSASDFYPFHMPGHKRNPQITGADLPYGIDITEIDGFDDLHHASSILKEAEERAARVYHAGETHYLINGSTAGILSAVLGCSERGRKILIARNCHKSVYNAVYLNELHPVYVYPEFDERTGLNGEIRPEKVARILKSEQDICAVVITSPTYDGVVSDVRMISDIAHEKGIPLIVDEAHGAHFGFHPYFPENSNQAGADVVIHSLHKTLPSLTQTALLHINGGLADRRRIRKYLHLLQTSSPSYILMAGMDECIRAVSGRNDVWTAYTESLERTRKELGRLKYLRLLKTERYDRSKLVISAKGTLLKRADGSRKEFTGRELYRLLLERYHLQMEMAAGSYIIAMTGPGDTNEGLQRLVSALVEIDKALSAAEGQAGEEAEENRTEAVQARENGFEKYTGEENCSAGVSGKLQQQEQVLSAWDAEQLKYSGEKTRTVAWADAGGKVSLEYAYLYPPGIPLVVPGERIGKETARQMTEYQKMGFSIEGTEESGKIEVWING